MGSPDWSCCSVAPTPSTRGASRDVPSRADGPRRLCRPSAATGVSRPSRASASRGVRCRERDGAVGGPAPRTVGDCPAVVHDDPPEASAQSGFAATSWHPALKGAGIQRTRANGLHALRHFYASALLHAGESIKAVAEWLGHANPAFTLRVYAHLMPDSPGRARTALDALFGGSDATDGPATAQKGS
ncbi:tyrosine-type recombinase/integrase [Actinoplanes sp. NPDC049681]|uniref:tyrosine-type recombinase/integrase n=1 Tax=Actinoplanes sp. NPDC049681 TaxID=3363905 RepID=UPI003792DE8D